MPSRRHHGDHSFCSERFMPQPVRDQRRSPRSRGRERGPKRSSPRRARRGGTALARDSYAPSPAQLTTLRAEHSGSSTWDRLNPPKPAIGAPLGPHTSSAPKKKGGPIAGTALKHVLVAEAGLEPALPKKADFESAASAIPPLGQERRVSNATRRCRQSPRQPTEAEPPPASGYLGDQRTPLSAT